MRLDYAAVAPEATKALAGVNAALLRAGLDKRLRDLLFLRVSQINGCSYCVDEHARDLRQAGESNERLDGLAGWRESPYFTEPEKAALEWAEVLTHVDITHAPDAAYEPIVISSWPDRPNETNKWRPALGNAPRTTKSTGTPPESPGRVPFQSSLYVGEPR